MSEWITGVIESMGYWGVAFLMALENVFPPIPSELVMPLAGYVSSQGSLDVWLVVVVGTVGAVIGTLPWYGLARWLNKDKVYAWVERHGHWLTVERRELEHAEKWFSRRGRWVVAAARLVPGVRTLISVPAGFAKVPLLQYLAYTLAGTVLWTGALAHLGKALGENYSRISNYVGHITYGVVGTLLLIYLVRLVRMRRRNHTRSATARRQRHA